MFFGSVWCTYGYGDRPMTKLTITHRVNDKPRKKTFEDPEFAQVLCNINEVAVDGETYANVTEVEFHD